MNSWLAIVNPHAGSAKGRKTKAAVLNELRSHCQGTLEVAETEYAGHASLLARKAADSNYATVLSLGGDGTHNEVLNGLLDSKGRARNPDIALGVVNAGTGGDFVRFLYGRQNPRKIASAIALATPRAIDIGLCTFRDFKGEPQSRLFLNIASCGLSGEVVHRMKNSSLRAGGQFSYLLHTIRALLGYKSTQLKMTLDGTAEISEKIQTVAFANGQYFGGGMKIAPQSDMEDGLLDIVAVEDMPFLSTLLASPKLYMGAHLSHPKVHSSRAKKVSVEPLDPQAGEIRVELDGEQPGTLPATFTNIPRALKLLVPEGGLA